MRGATPAGGLRVGQVHRPVRRTVGTGLHGMGVGGGDLGEVLDVSGERRAGEGRVERWQMVGIDHKSAVFWSAVFSETMRMFRSTATAEWVSAPTEM